MSYAGRMLMIEASSPASCRVQASHIAAEADARIEFLETAFASLQAENAELRKDAERWRFIDARGSRVFKDFMDSPASTLREYIDAEITGAAK